MTKRNSKSRNGSILLLGRYLKEIGKYPLLTRDQEIAIGRTIEAEAIEIDRTLAAFGIRVESGNHHCPKHPLLPRNIKPHEYPIGLQKARSRIVRQLNAHRSAATGARAGQMTVELPEQKLALTQGELDRLCGKLNACEQRANRAKAELIKSNLKLVVSVAKRFRKRGLSLIDLIQEGNIGLISAANRYDYHLTVKFSYYASWWIRQGILFALEKKSRFIRLPSNINHLANRLERHGLDRSCVTDSASSAHGSALLLQLPDDLIDRIMRVTMPPLSLDAPSRSENGAVLYNTLKGSETLSPHRLLEKKQAHVRLRETIQSLPRKEAQIIRMRYGIDTPKSYTLAEMSGRFGLSRERIRQIEMKAIDKMRHPSRLKRLILLEGD